ncbi:MAG: hypothetical protein V4850_22190 [Myxococcota bacterium]
MKTFLPLMIVLLPALSCAPAYDDIPVKLVGVGYDPDEIGPSPIPYGGVVEYSWVNFAGGGLSLALMGLGSFDEVGPQMVGYSPPYAAVYGFSYVFDTKLSAADSLGGVTSVPPEVDDTCYTTFQAAGPIGSFKTVDVGSWMDFSTEDGEGGMRLDRLPADYPDNEQDLFIYYSSVDYWATEPIYGLTPRGDSVRPDRMEPTLVRRRNFPFGESVEFSFPGALAGQEAPVGSLPRPSSAVGNTTLDLPNRPGGVQLSWNGTRYDAFGHATGDGEQATCLSYAAPGTVPDSAAACDGADSPSSAEFSGQMYTGPWDTEDEQVTFRWTAGDGENADEFVSLAVRFLGPVDRDDRGFGERVVFVGAADATEAVDTDWRAARRAGSIPDDAEIPDGRRAPTACEPGEWVFDDTYVTDDGGLAPALRGDPMNNVAEVTCRLQDDGEFVLSNALIEEALTYARIHGAEGAVFYLARSTEVEARVPPAKDQYRQKLDISPIKLTSRAIDIGRFWLE